MAPIGDSMPVNAAEGEEGALEAAQEYYETGVEQLSELRFREAIASLERAGELVEHPQIYLSLGVSYSKLNLDSAREDLRSGISLLGKLQTSDREQLEGTLYHELGRVELEKKEFAAALRSARRSLSLGEERLQRRATNEIRSAVGGSLFVGQHHARPRAA